jgi:hypothetical protein
MTHPIKKDDGSTDPITLAVREIMAGIYPFLNERGKTTSVQIIEALVAQAKDAIFATELSFCGGSRRCDFWTISANSSAGFKSRAYEVKVSRADFKRDTSIKQREARLFSDQFFYVVPAGLLKPEEVPDWAGLIEYHDGKLRTIVHAPYRDKDAPTWELVVSLIRNSGQINRDTDLLKQRLRHAEQTISRAKKAVEIKGFRPWEVGL